MNNSDYNNVLNSVIEETQSCKKVKKKSRVASTLILLTILLVVCVAWIALS